MKGREKVKRVKSKGKQKMNGGKRGRRLVTLCGSRLAVGGSSNTVPLTELPDGQFPYLEVYHVNHCVQSTNNITTHFTILFLSSPSSLAPSSELLEPSSLSFDSSYSFIILSLFVWPYHPFIVCHIHPLHASCNPSELIFPRSSKLHWRDPLEVSSSSYHWFTLA
jgi:hypothetical protein